MADKSPQANLVSVSLDLQMHVAEIIFREKVSTEVGEYTTPENLKLHSPNDLHFLVLHGNKGSLGKKSKICVLKVMYWKGNVQKKGQKSTEK